MHMDMYIRNWECGLGSSFHFDSFTFGSFCLLALLED